MIVKLLSYTDNAVELCASAGRTCYSDKPAHKIIGKGSPEKTLKPIIEMGHHSVIEHAVYTFSISGVSRALSHQLVRHRIASFSQQSQRYVSMEDVEYVIPPAIRSNPQALKTYNDVLNKIRDAYTDISKIVPQEDARYILPNATPTNIVVTMNARSLLNFFSLRCCNRAQWEIRELAEKMLIECKKVTSVIFDNAGAPCKRGVCPEGDKSCKNK